MNTLLNWFQHWKVKCLELAAHRFVGFPFVVKPNKFLFFHTKHASNVGCYVVVYYEYLKHSYCLQFEYELSGMYFYLRQLGSTVFLALYLPTIKQTKMLMLKMHKKLKRRLL